VKGNHEQVDLQVFGRLDDLFAWHSDAKLGPAITVSLFDLFSKGLESVPGIVKMPFYRYIRRRTARIGHIVKTLCKRATPSNEQRTSSRA
jgi:hypothetical protein